MSRLLLATLLLAAPLHAQYEQMLKETPPADAPPAPPPPPAPRLLAPTLHKQKIAFLDQSADGAWLLTADPATLRLWDAAHRANLFTLHADTALRKSIDFAAFTADGHDLLVLTGGHLRRYRGLPADDAFEDLYLGSAEDRIFHRPTNTLVSARFEQANPRVLRLTLVRAGEKLTTRRLQINLHSAYPAAQWFRLHPDNGLSLDASGRLLAVNFTSGAALAVIDLEAGQLTATVPADRGPLGLAPDGAVLLAQTANQRATFGKLDPATGRVTPAFDLAVKNNHAYPILPRRQGDPLQINSSGAFYLHDFATGQTSARLAFGSRYFDRAILYRDRDRARPLIAMSTAAPDASGQAASTHLEFMDPATGDSRGPWLTETFAPAEIFARADDFDFLVRRGQDLRRVRVTEAGLQIEPLAFQEGQLYPQAAYFDRAAEAWFMVGSGSGSLITPVADSPGLFSSRGAGLASSSATPKVYFNSTRASARSRDGRLLALHHGRGIVVLDLATRRAVADFSDDAASDYFRDSHPQIALAPDGSAVVFTYAYDRGGQTAWRTECRELPTGTLRWSSNAMRGPFAFNPDGSRLYDVGFATEFYATTGERAAGIDLGYITKRVSAYNAAGTLLAVATDRALKVVALPGGRPVADFTLTSRPTALAFVGSDRFLLANAADDEQLHLYDLKENTALADIYLFESPQKWLVLNPATGLFSSEVSLQDDLQFAVGAQLTPLASYLDEFYRPRLLGSLIQGLTPRPAIPLSDLRYAPKLTLKIDGPATRGLTVEDEFESYEIPTPEVTLRLDATCEGAPVTDLRVYHNGKLVAGATRGLFVEDDEDAPSGEIFTKSATRTFTLTPGKNRFRAVALNAQGTESAPDEVIVWSQASPAAADTGGLALHVVTIGVNTYQNPAYNLNYARADATAVDAALRARLGPLFTRTHFHTLYDAEATRANILATLDTVKREAGPRDTFVLYYAGHGVMSEEDDPEFFLAPHEITQLYGERRVLRRLGVSSEELLAYSRDIPAQKQLFILDACQSAGALKTLASRGAVEERAIAQLARSSGTHWLTATGSEQFATEFAKLGHGAFTHVLLEALGGAADAGDGLVTVNELKAYLEAKVPALTAAEKGAAQYPVTYGYGQDFPLAVVTPDTL
ncbi:MAG: caspase family protein [Opitutaceae bacterium]|nr:caspase family protein [Opitutaceae bacterium]